MSERTAPIGMMFDIQQRTIEQTTETMRRGFEVQQRLVEAMFDLDPAMQAHEDVEDPTVRTTESANGGAGARGESVEVIDGLGPTYSDRLQEQGIDSLGALTRADPGAVAETADVSKDVAAEWIEAAQSSA